MSGASGVTAPPVVAVGASAGGIEAVRTMLRHFPADLGATVLIVLHRAPVEHDDRLTRVLSRESALPLSRAREGERPVAGRAYVAAAGTHLELVDGAFVLSVGPKVNGMRPSVDVLFRSVAASGVRAIGIVLSGVLDDGTAGLAALKAAGGYAIVQDPEEAIFTEMPRNAIANVVVDAVEPVERIGAVVARRLAAISHEPAIVVRRAAAGEAAQPTGFSCPDCGGVLFRHGEGELDRYACRIGHAFSPATLYDRQYGNLETALWGAVRSLEERAEMSGVLATGLRRHSLAGSAQRLDEQAASLYERAAAMRYVLASVAEKAAEVHADDFAVDA